MTPAGVTLLSGISGLAAGHLYYYRDLRLNFLGMALLIISNALDNADGQLARLTNKGSRAGRILDSISDHIVLLGIYLHLSALSRRGRFSGIWLLALAAGLSHAVQGGSPITFVTLIYFLSPVAPGRRSIPRLRLRDEYVQLLWRRSRGRSFFFASI